MAWALVTVYWFGESLQRASIRWGSLMRAVDVDTLQFDVGQIRIRWHARPNEARTLCNWYRTAININAIATMYIKDMDLRNSAVFQKRELCFAGYPKAPLWYIFTVLAVLLLIRQWVRSSIGRLKMPPAMQWYWVSCPFCSMIWDILSNMLWYRRWVELGLGNGEMTVVAQSLTRLNCLRFSLKNFENCW